MVKEIYACEICNFVYIDKKTAVKCEQWCREHKSCSLQITKSAIGILKRLSENE